MKIEKYTCDSCGFETTNEKNIRDASIFVSEYNSSEKLSRYTDRMVFHVCTTCWPEKKKSVFKVMFNKLVRNRDAGGVVK